MAVPKAVSVGTSATELIAQNEARTKIHIQNLHGSTKLYLGQDNTVTISNGFEVAAASATPASSYVEERTVENSDFFYWGAIWGIVASSTVDVRVWEKERIR